MRAHGDGSTGCSACGAVVDERASYCPDCGAAVAGGVGDEPQDWNRGFGDPDADYIQDEGQPRRPPNTHGEGVEGYANLVGDLYWRTAPGIGDVLFVLAGILYFVPRDTFFSTFEGVSQWLLANHPGAFVWVFQNYPSFPWFFFGAAVVSHLALNPDPVR